MRGNLTERAPGVWQLRVGAGKDPVTGAYRVVRHTVRGTREQAEAALARVLRAVVHPSGGVRRPAARALTPRPFPIEPLLEATGLPAAAIRRAVRASSATMRTVAERGLTAAQADRWAISLGFHPGVVWASWWEPGEPP